MAVTWFGLLQVVHSDDRDNLLRKIETPKESRPKGVVYDELFEGLSYNPETELVAVSSVKVNSKTGKFFENSVYVFKIKTNKLALLGYYNRSYSPTKRKFFQLKSRALT